MLTRRLIVYKGLVTHYLNNTRMFSSFGIKHYMFSNKLICPYRLKNKI
jgi:hypothetical protein